MSAATAALQTKRTQLGIQTHPKKGLPQTNTLLNGYKSSELSPNPLRLLAPRSVSLVNAGSTKTTTETSAAIHAFRRHIKFGDSNEELPICQPSAPVEILRKEKIVEERAQIKAPTCSPRPSASVVKNTERAPVKVPPATPLPGVRPNANNRITNESNTPAQEVTPHYDRIPPPIFDGWSGCALVKPPNREAGVGLFNPLNNCFLNSVLQAVVHTPQLARTILELRDGRMCTSMAQQQSPCFHCALRIHIQNAVTKQYPMHTKWIDPYLKRIFPHHRSGTQEDAHEMLTLLLGALEPFPTKKANLKIHGTPEPVAGSSTPIEQVFGGELKNKIVCMECSQEHINYERIREINLGLTRSFRTDIDELIQDFFKEEQLHNFHCTNCKQKRNAKRTTCLLKAPTVLIIQLKRFNIFGGKNRLDVRPKKFTDLGRYSTKDGSIIYRLNGVIEHIGGGINFGHYVCAMRGFKGNWFKFDDSERKVTSLDEVVSKMDPYILFYTRASPPVLPPQPRRSLDNAFTHSTPKRPRYSFPHNNNNNNGGGVRRWNNNSYSHRSFSYNVNS